MRQPLLSPRPTTLDRSAFVEAYGSIYEHSPWIAEEAWDSGLAAHHDSPAGLVEAMATVLDAASAERQLAVIRAHPDLAGKVALDGGLTQASSQEQAGAGLDQCTPDELARFERLNAAYKERFGFPFVMAVKGYHRREILDAFEARLAHTPDEERRTAITQIHRIARLRLDAHAA
ncbi:MULTISPECIES: 2-oxo-4-hydroxy-4-carboxy-5-ureidoimidazoline decarboxylase [Chromohalobacter]|uniref:2-oxo-4-hydroxy-4-carboxy-5-ureidoimidazoline decarboxylase n=1 Tax=Chromohalobacter TaxID=42054 RepID=UPI001FFD31D8|nr:MULTISPECIES: 2-oxo-4-hydroxy-4-carboxy-5-ureidoimidazoline decarboxylase [Chromohalobacter]MCK2046048.1 2-oxo-4-hydroxy-4-carboxy-5-ureidoimidazoline decarboxylase [Chromohalobacter moromii]MCT8468996.1 2-oxo-4-hydroxy-4-carboxy-5-ureidoimidazoline decarboxylase [Chromohalobacter canadensis]MCT8472814.1 2-oxo-4-hydroxy-4-carboxy-5-ureidoimidazoline decarboxylase [Chromohalobacter canadensis]MCT8500266.1 2-oxo-4-hydroxy-4-carboxy-5-ureidoimidazoline decarboxylase [Chromohalobacter canadensis